MQTIKLRRHNQGTKEHKYMVADCAIDVPDCDTDIRLILPDGRNYIIQYRVETPSLDICFEKEKGWNNPLKQHVHCINSDLSNGKVVNKKQNLIECEQVTIVGIDDD